MADTQEYRVLIYSTGLAESGFYPGIVFLLGSWCKCPMVED
jgi:hypothetical protein